MWCADRADSESAAADAQSTTCPFSVNATTSTVSITPWLKQTSPALERSSALSSPQWYAYHSKDYT